MQNVKYLIPDFNLYLYNIHMVFYTVIKKIKFIFENSFIPFLKQSKKEIIIYWGNLNFQMKTETIDYLKDIY